MAKQAQSTGADKTAKKVPGIPFKKGEAWNGNAAGRPKGARNKLSEDFIRALAADFEANGVSTIEKLREENPTAYVKTVADLVPKQFDLGDDTADVFGMLWSVIAAGGAPQHE